MTRTVVLGEPPAPLAEWLEGRRRLGQDLFDEVWEGEYHVVPAPHRRHGDVDDQIAALLRGPARDRGLWPSGPANIGQPHDYRVPNRAYFSSREPAAFEPTATVVVAIVSAGDESFAKLGFYFAHDIGEVLLVDPDRQSVQWYSRGADGFEPSDRSAALELTEAELAALIDWPS